MDRLSCISNTFALAKIQRIGYGHWTGIKKIIRIWAPSPGKRLGLSCDILFFVYLGELAAPWLHLKYQSHQSDWLTERLCQTRPEDWITSWHLCGRQDCQAELAERSFEGLATKQFSYLENHRVRGKCEAEWRKVLANQCVKIFHSIRLSQSPVLCTFLQLCKMHFSLVQLCNMQLCKVQLCKVQLCNVQLC